jgi:hypothetical protein
MSKYGDLFFFLIPFFLLEKWRFLIKEGISNQIFSFPNKIKPQDAKNCQKKLLVINNDS